MQTNPENAGLSGWRRPLALLALLSITIACCLQTSRTEAMESGTIFRIRGMRPLGSGLDSDGDGLPDAWELSHGLNPYDSSDAASDWDGDGLTALQECLRDADPWRLDSDGDGVADVVDTHVLSNSPGVDGNGIPDDWELFWLGSVGGDPGSDVDGDGASAFAEFWAGTDPRCRTVSDSEGAVTLIILKPAG